VQNADAAAQRAAIKALYKVEAWKPVAEFELKERRRFWAGQGGLYKFFRWTLNGHLLPFYNIWGNRIVLQPRDRNNFAPVWGASSLTYLNSTREKAYTVRQSKTRFVAQTFRLLWLTARLYFGYGALLAKYRKGYAEITVPSFWQKVLKLTKTPSKPTETALAKYPGPARRRGEKTNVENACFPYWRSQDRHLIHSAGAYGWCLQFTRRVD
jgi:hypothetical protein